MGSPSGGPSSADPPPLDHSRLGDNLRGMSQETAPAVGLPVSHVPVYDDKAGIRETLDFSRAEWIRGSDQETASSVTPGDVGEHVEIAFVTSEAGDDYVGMRNSAHPEGPILVFTPAEWDAFIEGAKDGEFDEP